jgi:hypothetical protein
LARLIDGGWNTPAAERQDPVFLNGPRNKKKRKKGRPLKFFIHRSKLQAGTSDDDGHRDSQLIGAIMRPRPTNACPVRKRRGCSGRTSRNAPASVCLISSEMPACNLDRWMKNFNGRPFFRFFFYCAGQSEKPDLGARPPE